MIFESHAHYDSKEFDEDREILLASMPECGIHKIINVGCNIASCQMTEYLMKEYPHVYGAMGVHPSEIDCLSDEMLLWLMDVATHDKVVAVGEIGLDYYWEKDADVRTMQQYWFMKQLEIARDLNLPVIVHSRDAAEDTLEIIREAHNANSRGVIHCFSYSKEIALEYVKLGYHIGVGGVVTFKNAKKLKEVVEAVPIERILVETDCPYMAPEPFRGKRNSSLYIPNIITEIAKIKGMSHEEVESITYQNGMMLFDLDE